jgi:hypothetical protein
VSVPVVPGHPTGRVGGDLWGVSLQFRQVVEWIGSAEFAGVNEAHVDVGDVGPVFGLVEHRVLAVQDDLLQGAFADVVVQRSPGKT